MAIHPAIRRLNADLHRLKRHQGERHRDRVGLQKDVRELRSDRKALGRGHKELKKDINEFKKDRAALDRTVAAERKELEALEARQRPLLEKLYEDSFDPAGAGQPIDPALTGQVLDIWRQEEDVRQKFGAKIDGLRQEIQHDRQEIGADRQFISAKRREVQRDRREIQHDRRELARDIRIVHRDRRKALHDLLPAEYRMGLKQTNLVRRELGLRPVNHVIRPGVPNVVGGQLGGWIAQAQTILKQSGIPMSLMNAFDIAIIARHESGGNPNAQNNWDSNAAAGHPSVGLMQTIGPTFDAYKLPGHGNIRNPVDNIIAAVRYAIARYGSISNAPGVRAVHAGRPYVGY